MKAFQCNPISIPKARWAAYATAGVAGAFGLSSSAEAEIHYSGNVFIPLTGYARTSLPLSNGASLVFENFGGSTFWQHFDFLIKGVISGSARKGVIHNWVADLPSGENVSAGEFYSVAGHPGYGVLIANWSDGYFAPPEFERLRGFVGFRFNTGNGTQYGWARIQTKNDGHNRIHDVIKDYAWGDVGDRIRTGQKNSAGEMVDTVTESGSVGLLALGAAGLVAWRKRREPAI
jgi:MYXO-CTERM domain-containing protein